MLERTNEDGQRERGWGPWRAAFWTLCSTCPRYTPGCPRCSTGEWRRAWVHVLSSAVYARWPRFWRWGVNLPFWPGPAWLRSFPRLRDRSWWR